jgi:hypothetical protein
VNTRAPREHAGTSSNTLAVDIGGTKFSVALFEEASEWDQRSLKTSWISRLPCRIAMTWSGAVSGL